MSDSISKWYDMGQGAKLQLSNETREDEVTKDAYMILVNYDFDAIKKAYELAIADKGE